MIIIPENLEIHKPDKKLSDIIENTEIKEKLLFKKKSAFHEYIFVVENKIGRFIKYNDTYQAGYFNSEFYRGNIPYINYFLIPYLLNKNIEKILFIGFGSGLILNQYEEIFSKLKSIDIVDIEENIFPIAEKYFNFKISDKMNFYLQDAIVFLKTSKTKYDLIITDIAGNTGIDDRLTSIEYIKLIKKHLKAKGIFVSNLPSSRDIFNKKNKFILNILDKYKENFSNITLFNGEESNKIYYKTFFNIDEPVYDITNAVIFCSDFDYKLSNFNVIKEKLNINIANYLKDMIKIL